VAGPTWRRQGKMASKRKLRRDSCEGKKRHKTKALAWRAATKTSEGVRPYKCGFCREWHNGHEPGKQKRRKTSHA
jgi:hypothetical protein